MIKKTIAQLKLDEGLMLKPYKDSVGVWTIGYGRNLEKRGISEDEAELLFFNDVNAVIHDLKEVLPVYWELDEVRRSVMINMAFNLGINGLLGFKKMIAALEKEDYNKAGDEMVDSKWYGQVGNRATRLVAMMRFGEWPEGNK